MFKHSEQYKQNYEFPMVYSISFQESPRSLVEDSGRSRGDLKCKVHSQMRARAGTRGDGKLPKHRGESKHSKSAFSLIVEHLKNPTIIFLWYLAGFFLLHLLLLFIFACFHSGALAHPQHLPARESLSGGEVTRSSHRSRAITR